MERLPTVGRPVSPKRSNIADNGDRHDGLTRGTVHLKSCTPEEENCRHTSPQLLRYDGYKHFRESAFDVVPCVGPRGLWMNESDDDAVWAYRGKAVGKAHLSRMVSPILKTFSGAVDPVIGSYEASGLDGDVSFDRVGRYQAYGLEQFESMDVEGLKTSTDVNWDNVRWGELQAQCVEDNRQRFRPFKQRAEKSFQYPNVNHNHGRPGKSSKASETLEPSNIKPIQRTAILVRVWTGAPWTADAVLNLRALIAETSLASGGKYQVFVLLHVKNEVIPLFVGEHQPEATIKKHVPPEFHSVTEVWNHAQIRSLYSGLSEHAFVGRSPWMIVQWFARHHPEFDFFYQWEFDVRYTGHYLDFFEAVSTFGKAQPRKQIWERASRVYIPSVHGAFDTDFRKLVAEEDPHHVWGPVKVEGVKPRGPKVPHQQEVDNYSWGKGEDADWIGFLPSFNITNTNWWFRDHLWGYAQGTSTPRRATLIAQGRVSRRVLDIMNYENTQNGHHLDAEMFPQTMCLHHGLKSTTFPHPIFADREWTPETLQSVFNPGPFGQAGGVWESTFSKWNEYAWSNMTWYYNSAQAKPIFQRMLGVTANERGGSEWEDVFGRAVVRPMLLHPVKLGRAWIWQEGQWLETKGGKS